MQRIGMAVICALTLSALAQAEDLSTASSQDLMALYRQLRAIQGGSQAASAENVVFKRDAATFTFLNGRILFSEPIAGQVLAAQFQGEGSSNLNPRLPSIRVNLHASPEALRLSTAFAKQTFSLPMIPLWN